MKVISTLYRSGVLWVVTAAALAGQVGCGGGLASVSGSVTFGGQPVEDGEVRLVPTGTGAGAGQVTGATIVQGRYDIPGDKGALPGTYRVEIRAQKKTGKKLPSIPPATPGTTYDETIQFIPPKYNDQSTLTVDLKSGSNAKDFELTK